MKRKYLFQLLFLGVLLLLQSCEVQIMDDRRILVKGNIVDSSNNPIPGISVRCESSYLNLGEAISDANGQFEFTSLEVETYNSLNITVNVKEDGYYYYDDYNYGNLENPAYSAKNYFNNATNRNAATYNLGRIQLNEVARLALFINNTPGDNNSLAYKLNYDTSVCQIDLNVSDSEDCKSFDDSYNQLDPSSSSFDIELESQLGTTVLFKYILNNEPEQTIAITLTNLENTYVFEY
jgi:hypothetical protein